MKLIIDQQFFLLRMLNSANSREHGILLGIEIPDYAKIKHYHVQSL